MQLALVSIQFEIVVSALHREEDIRLHAHGIYKIEHGKVRMTDAYFHQKGQLLWLTTCFVQLTQAMVVVDMHEASSKAPEIPACVIA